MKTAIISRVNLFSISMLLFSSSFAQKGFNSQSAYSTSSYHKQHTEFSPAIAKNSGNESVAVTEKTMKHF